MKKESTNTEITEETIEAAILYIKSFFADNCNGHDSFHTLRVFRMATELARKEGADVFLVQLAALLHDVDDRKLSPQTQKSKGNALAFMKLQHLSDETCDMVCTIINQVSFSGGVIPASIEAKCVQDADRLDAIGAIGIARAFAYGGSHGRTLYDPEIKLNLNITKEEYRIKKSSTVNHFYEKLFTLKDTMNTKTAKDIAEHRHNIMEKFIEEFLKEW